MILIWLFAASTLPAGYQREDAFDTKGVKHL